MADSGSATRWSGYVNWEWGSRFMNEKRLASFGRVMNKPINSFQVNDESVENMSTSQIIDLLRIIRGAICLTVLRKEGEDEEAAVAVEPAE